MTTRYSFKIEGEKVSCLCELDRPGKYAGDNYLEADTTKTTLALGEVRGTLIRYKNFQVDNPNFNSGTDPSYLRTIVEKREMARREGVVLSQDMVSFMRFHLELLENRGVKLEDSSLDSLFEGGLP